jgi:hypothetical protein
MNISELKKIAQENPLQIVKVYRKKVNPKTGKTVWDSIDVIAKVAYRNLAKSFDERVSGWKRCYLEQNEGALVETPSFKFDTNSLSNPELIQKLEEAGFVKKEVVLPVIQPEKKKDLSDFSEEEIKAYLKAKKAELKKEATEETNSNPENESI